MLDTVFSWLIESWIWESTAFRERAVVLALCKRLSRIASSAAHHSFCSNLKSADKDGTWAGSPMVLTRPDQTKKALNLVRLIFGLIWVLCPKWSSLNWRCTGQCLSMNLVVRFQTARYSQSLYPLLVRVYVPWCNSFISVKPPLLFEDKYLSKNNTKRIAV